MRKKVRGLRKIEQAVIGQQKAGEPAGDETPTPAAHPSGAVTASPGVAAGADAIVLEYCAAVRGILNDDLRGPLWPPGLRMAKALGEVRDSL